MNVPLPMLTRSIRATLSACAAATLCLTSAGLHAAATDIANSPLANSQASAVKPNIMFILDNSGSMKDEFMPDDVPQSLSKYAIWAAQCNGVAYNPATVYKSPVDSSGNPLGDASFTAASFDGYMATHSTTSQTISTGSTLDFDVDKCTGVVAGDAIRVTSTSNSSNYMTGTAAQSCSANNGVVSVTVTGKSGSGTFTAWQITRDLSANSAAKYYTYAGTAAANSGTQPALDYTFTGSSVNTGTDFYKQCNSNIGSTPGSNVFTAVTLTGASSATAKTNYANWYAYYRTRRMAMRGAAGLAFADLSTDYRVGFSTISDTGVTEGSGFLNVRDFDATQKSNFYTKLYAAVGNSNTPLRGALSKAGQYFAKKVSGQSYDPMQYSCQRNFSILTTDGYWNTGSETASYKALKLDGSSLVDQQDGLEARPMNDGALPRSTTVTTWNTTRTLVTQTATTTTTYSGARNNVTGTYAAGTGSRTDTYSTYTTNSTLTRCAALVGGNCTVTVSDPGHGYSGGGNKVTIIDAVPAAYNGSYTIVVVNSSTYTYTIGGLSSRPAAATNAGKTLKQGSCPAGQGSVTRTRNQIDTYALTLQTILTANKVATTSYTQPRQVTVTPYTQTVVITNGATTSDTTVPGTPTVTNTLDTPPANLVVPGTYASAPTTSAGTTYTATAAPVVTNNFCSTTVATATTAVAPVSAAPTYTPTSTATTAPATGIVGPSTTTLSDSGQVEGTKTAATPVIDSVGGVSNTLADIAQYYWATDLRTSALGNCTGNGGNDVCDNTTLKPTSTDPATYQHMDTYTMGLANGTLAYRNDYLEAKDTAGTTYYQLTQGTLNWPAPSDTSAGPTNIDDLWHAAVDGRGRYYNARDAAAMVASLKSTLRKISAETGSGSAAATSALELVSGTNYVYQALYTTQEWYGDVKAYTLAADGTIDTSTTVWSARTQLDAATSGSSDSRTIYYFKPTSGFQGTLRPFTYANLTTDGFTANLNNACAGSLLSQCSSLTTGNQTLADSGVNLVNYLRGQTGYEALTNLASPLFRERTSVLGDIVGGSPVYVGAPSFSYSDTGYTDFKTTQASRAATLYTGANDGMLHAFNASTGAERWAFIPNAMLSGLYRLADANYGANHRYYVDGAPVVGDIYAASAWRTIVVGGLNAGGNVYYALDITDPANPVALWEFSNANLGKTFGNPVITKRADGTWVVVFASGHNNTSGGGDGNGHLFVVNAYTGALITSVATYSSGTTPVGNTTTPSGLSKINAWIESDTNNTAARFYGGDLLGNLWRFDIDNVVLPNSAALRLAQLQVSSVPQPITTRPVLASLKYAATYYPVVFVGTGELLGTSDLSTTQQQAIYAIKDPLTNTPWGDVRASSSFVQQTLTTTATLHTMASPNAVNWATKGGWYLDLPTSGERVNVNMALQFNTLTAASNIPSGDAICLPSGTSWLYNIDILTGGSPSGTTVGSLLGAYMVAGIGQVELQNKKTISIISTSTGTLETREGGTAPATFATRRSSWRELSD